eukprot:c4163_g1_i1.p2 GENE.c4163_g1_i1~~c4163_g1_i1.p2  ORF type:complete len:133 (+),score=30.75 c4163_g1_i1:49-399(+)
MVVRLRFARFGRVHAPMYRLMAADSRYKRDGRHLEVLGSFDPAPDNFGLKHMQLNVERVKYWLTCGAQPTKPVAKLLGLAGILPRPPITDLTRPAVPDAAKYCRAQQGAFLNNQTK